MNKVVDCDGKMVTFTGRYVDPFNLSPDDIDIKDIAHALSLICRYGGHTKKFYSVAEHCLYLSDRMNTPEFRLLALLHDAPEAYVGDMVRCVKHRLPEHQEIELRVWTAIVERYGLTDFVMPNFDLVPIVKEGDYRMAVTELLQLITNQGSLLGIHQQYLPYDIQIIGYSPEEAERLFLEKFVRLASILEGIR